MTSKKPTKTISPISKTKVRKGKFAGTKRKDIGGTVPQPTPLSRYTVKK